MSSTVADIAAPAPRQEGMAQDGLPLRPRIIAAIAIIACVVLVVLDGSVTNVALPSIVRALHVAPAASIWVVNGYQMAIVMVLLPVAALGERYGYRPGFVAGVVIFTLGSLVCSVSPSLPWLVLGRFIQGLGGGAIMALGLALMRFVFPRRQLGAAIGWNALAIALTSAAAPSIGAAILSALSWPWLFVLNLPVGAVVLLASRSLPVVARQDRAIDPVSMLLNAAAFALLVIGAEFTIARPVLAAALLALGIAGIVALVRRERPKAAPLIPLDLLARRAFRLSIVASVFCFTGQMAGTIALPFYLERGLGLSVAMTGLAMTPWPLAVAIAAPLSSRAASRFPTAWLCAGGAACLAAGLALTAIWPVSGGLPVLLFFLVLCGLGFGFFQTPNNHNMLIAAPRERSGAAGGAQGMARLIGQTTGATMMSLIFALVPAAHAPRLGMAISAVLVLGAVAASLTRGATPD
jgi:DHA2 family multidrug resistance protein-like MFS transporter